jgi:hypothetical protein
MTDTVSLEFGVQSMAYKTAADTRTRMLKFDTANPLEAARIFALVSLTIFLTWEPAND